MASTEDLVAVGQVIKPHGVRGECCVHSYADSPALFDALDRVRLAPQGMAPSRGRRARIASWRPHKDRILVTFAGVGDRDQAEALRGMEIIVPVSELPPPGEDEFWLMELPGLEVRLTGGEVLGPIVRVDTPAEQELWVIDARGREVLFPAVPEFVAELDLEAGYVVIDPPPGLLDIYLDPEDEQGRTDDKAREDP